MTEFESLLVDLTDYQMSDLLHWTAEYALPHFDRRYPTTQTGRDIVTRLRKGAVEESHIEALEDFLNKAWAELGVPDAGLYAGEAIQAVARALGARDAGFAMAAVGDATYIDGYAEGFWLRLSSYQGVPSPDRAVWATLAPDWTGTTAELLEACHLVTA